jgi:hypothetical protein
VRSQWEEIWKVSSYSIHSINTSYSEVTIRRDMKGVIILHSLNKYFNLLSEWSMMTPYITLHIVTSLTEVFIEWMEYDDTFHISSYCDLTVSNIYWVNGVWWHLSYLFSLWPHCMKYLLSEWSMMTPIIPLLILTSLYEVFIGHIILHSLNKYFRQWGHNEQRYERCHHTPFTQ